MGALGSGLPLLPELPGRGQGSTPSWPRLLKKVGLGDPSCFSYLPHKHRGLGSQGNRDGREKAPHCVPHAAKGEDRGPASS